MRLDSRAAMACHEFLHKTNAPNLFNLGELPELTGMAREIALQGELHEMRVCDHIKVNYENCVEVERRLSREAREEITAQALLNENVDLVLGGTISGTAEKYIRSHLNLEPLGSPTRASSPDILVRVPGSDRSVPTWIPVDVKSHGAFEDNKSNLIWTTPLDGNLAVESASMPGRLKQDDALQLAHYVTHLNELGIGYEVPIAGVIGRDGMSITWAHLADTSFGIGSEKADAITIYRRDFQKALEIAKQAEERNSDPSVPAPAMPIYDGSAKKCPTCKYKDACLKELVSYKGSGHVTLLAGVTPSNLGNLPVDSISELARDPSVDPELRQRARVYESGVPEVIIGKTLDIPTFDIEIDIDLENSQGSFQELGSSESGEPDRVFLYGFIKHDRTKVTIWDDNDAKSFENYGGDSEAEFDVLSRMWNYLADEVSQAKTEGKSIGIFHYSPVEVLWFRRFAERYAGRTDVPTRTEVDQFVADYFHDFIKTAKQVNFPPAKKSPLCGYSIKTLAPLVPFSWHVDDPGGAEAIVKYRLAGESDEARRWLRCYNWDDVRATMALRNWMRDGMIMGRPEMHPADCRVCEEFSLDSANLD